MMRRALAFRLPALAFCLPALAFCLWAAAGAASAAPTGDYTREEVCNRRGAPADVVLTPLVLAFDGKTCRLMGPWRVVHEPTGTQAVRVTGCGQDVGTLYWATLKTTPLSTGKVLFSIDRPRTIFAAKLCRHVPPLPRGKP